MYSWDKDTQIINEISIESLKKAATQAKSKYRKVLGKKTVNASSMGVKRKKIIPKSQRAKLRLSNAVT